MSPRQVYFIAKREYISRVRNKAFIFMTLLVPLMLVVYIAVIPMLFTQTGVESLRLAILDQGTGLGEVLSERLREIETPKIEISQVVEIEENNQSERQAYSQEVRNDELDGYFFLSSDPQTVIDARYYARETMNLVILSRLQAAVRNAVLEQVLAGTGADVERVRAVERADIETVTVSEEGEEEGGFEGAFFSTLVFVMLLYMAVLINGQGMAMAIVSEKSSRLVEVILGAVTAFEFMSGKILGVLLSGLTQLLIWLVCAVIASLYALPGLAMVPGGFDLSSVLNPTILFYFSLLFLLGYLFYATLFAAIAATCSNTEEVSQALFPAMFPFILAFFATFYTISNPSTTISRVLSLIPTFTPLVMLARINVLMPPLWEIWLSIFLLILGIVGVAWAAAKIFRSALLMYGKRPSIPEIVRLVRMR